MNEGTGQSEFYRWMVRRFRDGLGQDPTGIDAATGEPLYRTFAFWASIALTDELDPVLEAHLARVFEVTPAQLRDVYLLEMQGGAMAELRAHPDLSSLDREAG